MKKIIKSKEPKEWTEYRLTPGVKYSPISELREALLKEQGYLCAYCMRRIPTKDGNSEETSRIEHLKSRKNPLIYSWIILISKWSKLINIISEIFREGFYPYKEGA